MKNTIVPLLVLLFSSLAFGQSTQPATRPAGSSLTDTKAIYGNLLGDRPAAPLPLAPVDLGPKDDLNKPVAPVKTDARLLPDGGYLVNRMGRLVRTADDKPEFRFEGDGQILADPPMVILPNMKLAQMENAVKSASNPLRFRVSGMVTEYNGRNYILIEKVVVANPTK